MPTDSNSVLTGISAVDLSDIFTEMSGASLYSTPGTFLTDTAKWKAFGEAILDAASRSMGNGGYNNTVQNFVAKLDRHGTAYVPPNMLNYGYTFITRPRLNLTTGNLRQHPALALLATDSPSSMAFAIRMLLDTCLSRGIPPFSYGGNNTLTPENEKLYKAASQNLLMDTRNPFFAPLCNGLKGVTGFPDFNIETVTMGEDFHSGDMTLVKGAELFNRTQELSLEFRDIQGSVILSIFFYWCLYMALQSKNVVMAYPDDIYEQRLNYTVSIYRFITDHTRRNILWWCKATGCFPKSAPVGSIFNVNQGEVVLSAAQNFSIPFTANCVEYNDPGIIFDFRRLLRRYNPDFDKWALVDEDTPADTEAGLYATRPDPGKNFVGLPDIITSDSGAGGLRLVWRSSGDSNSANDLYTAAAPELKSTYDDLTKLQESNMKDIINKIYK